MPKIKFALPELLKGIYLVPVSQVPKKLEETLANALDKHIPQPLSSDTLNALELKLATLDSGPTSKFRDIPLEMLKMFGATPDQLAKLTKAKSFIVIDSMFPPGRAPMHELVSRAAAAALAKELDSVLIDMFFPMLLSPDEAISTLISKDKRFRVVDWVIVPTSSGSSGCLLTTLGLCRFGLPEFQAIEVPPQLTRQWCSILSGLAYQLFDSSMTFRADGKASGIIDLPDCFELNDESIAAAYHRAPRGGGTAKIDVAFSDDRPEYRNAFLTVEPPAGYMKSAGEWMVEVADIIWGATEGEVVISSRGEAMQQAIAKAKETLPEIRERFISNQLPLTSQLAVKHLVTDGKAVEYVWSIVTDWTGSDLLRAICANDAYCDPSIRIGRPISVRVDSIIDWGLSLDGELMEGAFTQAVPVGN